MNIAGVQYNSFVDYPGHIATVVFTRGCNMRCPWCHNYSLISHSGRVAYAPEFVLSELERRKHFVDAVVVSGGEPTLQKGLEEFFGAAKALGLKTKLDTNGTNPDDISRLLDGRLLDYIAMDVKAPFERYREIAGTDSAGAKESIEIITRRAPDYEFRTTFVPELTKEDIMKIAAQIKGAKRYVIQQYRPTDRHAAQPHSPEEIKDILNALGALFPIVEARGL